MKIVWRSTESRQTRNAYTFMILLHEYLHTLGFEDDAQVRELSKKITDAYVGKGHIAGRDGRELPGQVLPRDQPVRDVPGQRDLRDDPQVRHVEHPLHRLARTGISYIPSPARSSQVNRRARSASRCGLRRAGRDVSPGRRSSSGCLPSSTSLLRAALAREGRRGLPHRAGGGARLRDPGSHEQDGRASTRPALRHRAERPDPGLLPCRPDLPDPLLPAWRGKRDRAPTSCSSPPWSGTSSSVSWALSRTSRVPWRRRRGATASPGQPPAIRGACLRSFPLSSLASVLAWNDGWTFDVAAEFVQFANSAGTLTTYSVTGLGSYISSRPSRATSSSRGSACS